jgi:hypothetical protein
VLAAAALSACAGGRIGGGGPLQYRALVFGAPAGASADSVASVVRQSAGDLVLIVSPGDSAWFAGVARGTTLHLSGPSGQPPLRLGFLAGKPVGDTTLTLPVAGGRPLLVHDALYQPQKHRYVDLMLVRVDSATSANAAARALLTYVATDVMQNAAVVLGLVAPSTAIADSVATAIRPLFVDARQCGDGKNPAPIIAPVHVLFGPETMIRCDEVRLLTAVGSPVFARFTIGAKQ